MGDIPTHWIPPGQPGFEEAGGEAAPGVDFLAKPKGDLALAKEYVAKSGLNPSQYTLFMVGDDSGVGAKTAQVFQAQLQKLGFKVDLKQVPHETMYAKFCNVPKADVAVCPNVGTLPDFADGQADLDVYFNGAAIVPENNSNWPLLDNPAINKAIDSAKQVIDPKARAKSTGGWCTCTRSCSSIRRNAIRFSRCSLASGPESTSASEGQNDRPLRVVSCRHVDGNRRNGPANAAALAAESTPLPASPDRSARSTPALRGVPTC